ncbi:hypothetical protein [Devosia sp. LC5]|uniref:hypothetical protein n=1 Tax=Devosia sp. LC5 TaxID=1502724 RepID=UPI0012682FAB|nr:hypothetical protein [Devosia sp. LC5]
MPSNSFVYIVESPSSADLFDGRTEGRALCEAMSMAGHAHAYTVAGDRLHLQKALSVASSEDRLIREWQRHQAPAVMHFSMHGNSDGLQLMSGELVTWHELRGMLLPINDFLPNGLLVCFSSCSGSSGTRMSMYLGDSKPFWAVIGSYDDVSWSDALVGFTTFYHHWFKGGAVADAVTAMRMASGHSQFIFEAGHESKRAYEAYVSQRTSAAGNALGLGLPSLPGPIMRPAVGTVS